MSERRRRMMGQSKRRLPPEYEEVKYLESYGKGAFIFLPNDMLAGDYFFASAFTRIAGSYHTVWAMQGFLEVYFDNPTTVNWWNVDGALFQDKKVSGTSSYNNFMDIEWSFSCSHSRYLTASKRLFTYSEKPNYFLFGGISKYIHKRGEQIIHDLIPTIRKSDNKPCMFDLVTMTPFFNDGNGEFAYEKLDGTYVAPI